MFILSHSTILLYVLHKWTNFKQFCIDACHILYRDYTKLPKMVLMGLVHQGISWLTHPKGFHLKKSIPKQIFENVNRLSHQNKLVERVAV